MSEITPEEAVRRVRRELALEEGTPARAWRVRRLDRPSEAYYLVEVGRPGATVAVAIVDANTGDIGISARLPGTGPHMGLDADSAARTAGGGDAAQAELVWMPCRASKSPLYPLWQVRTPRGVKYVDQQGRLFDRLDPSGLGG